MATVYKQDSNSTGLKFSEEDTTVPPGTLAASPVWYALEPNGYRDFGAQVNTVAREPLSASRQRKKGTVTGLDVTAGFETDVTQTNIIRLLQGVFFADATERKTNKPLNSTAISSSGVTGATKLFYGAGGFGGTTGLPTGTLLYFSGYSNSLNNGLKKTTGPTGHTGCVVLDSGETGADEVTTSGQYRIVGYEFASATCDLIPNPTNTTMPRLNRASGTFDWSSLGLVPGEWVWVGGDVAGNRFDTYQYGWMRFATGNSGALDFDKTYFPYASGATGFKFNGATSSGAGKTIRLFYGTTIQNATGSAGIKRRSYHLERYLGLDGTPTGMYEYVKGAVPSQMNLNVKEADKVTAEFAFVGVDYAVVTSRYSSAGGDVAALGEDPYNTASDVSRIRLSTVSATDPSPTALFAFGTDLQIGINNNVTALKAISKTTAFETSQGNFEVSGRLTAYFADTTGPAAIRANSDVTLDVITAKKPSTTLAYGMVWDVPLIQLGDGRLNVEKDRPITLPLAMNAAQSNLSYLNHTLSATFFYYLPQVILP